MTDKERELARKLRDAKRALAAESEIQRSLRAGYSAQLDRTQEQLSAARDELALERTRRVTALAAVSEVQQHNGRVYRRIKDIGVLVTAWESRLPQEFVREVRALTQPDFAELLEVRA